jgi:23S rRNA (pseudouridine1915-N3)-methyltransferase
MKFSELSAETWEQQHTYFDTCILPLSGLDGSEHPFEATKKLADLQKTLDIIEKLYRGRIVIYPACHYMTNLNFDELVGQVKQTFKFVVAATSSLMPIIHVDALDAIIQTTDDVRIKSEIEQLWQSKS